MEKTILKLENLQQHFEVPKDSSEIKSVKEKVFGTKKIVKALDNIDLEIYEGETFGLVGESGSGKSTLGRTVIRLYKPTAGTMEFNGYQIDGKLTKDLKLKLSNDMQMIFQDPFASVNPRMTIKNIIQEGIDIHYPKLSKKEKEAIIIKLLEEVGLSKLHLTRYPHEFSGGQLQRIGIARALAVKPKMIIADECISALDVSIQAQVVNLMKKLQQEHNLTYLFIAHDLSMVKYISDRIGVMYKGKLVEIATSDEIYNNPLHPYTKSLLSAIPIPDPEIEKTRTRFEYVPEKEHDYEKETPKMQKVNDNHHIYCSDQELEKYLKGHENERNN